MNLINSTRLFNKIQLTYNNLISSMKAIIATAFFLLVASASLIPGDEATIQYDVNWYIQSFKGVWDGYTSGFYGKAKKMNERCLDEETQDQMYNVIHFGMDPNPKMLFKFVTSLGGVVNNFDECEVDEVGKDLVMYCIENKKACETKQILTNVQTNLFQVIDKVNAIIALAPEFPSQDVEEIYDQTYTIGKSIGSLINYIYGYK